MMNLHSFSETRGIDIPVFSVVVFARATLGDLLGALHDRVEVVGWDGEGIVDEEQDGD
jgi:hypothetical protein